MNHPAVRVVLSVLAGSFVFGPVLCAQEGKEPGASDAASLQRQIDGLKENQVRILNELAEIKRLLQDEPDPVEFPARLTAPKSILINVHGEPFRGDRRARVAIMEFSDFDCSFCANYALEIYPQIDKDYIQPGKIKYYFRDLPAPGETNSLLKARAARCAGEQGKFWEMHDRLFATQEDPAGRDLVSQARALGMDVEKFSACLASDRYVENIRMSVAGARRAGIYGTPAFLIGSISEDGDFLRTTNVLVGESSLAPIKSSLDSLLASSLTVPP